MDVKVSVLFCIIEITRIIALDAPYKDEQMKEIFQLILAAFEKMSHVSTRSYKKVVSILDTIAKVKLCLVMLDLECDALVVEMFQSFLKIIRFNHPPAVLSAIETIMNLVIDESEDISLDLLSSLFTIVRKANQNVSWTLGEQIITRINAQLEKIMTPAQKLPSKLEGTHDVKVKVVERASDRPSTVLEDLHLGEVKEVKTAMLPMVRKVQDEIILIPHIDFVIPKEFDVVEFKFAGAAQSLGAGAILVNPWNITDVAASIKYALDMPADEREKRHQHNFKHVTTHTSQEWAATFVSELNDTIVEAQLRTRQVPPLLPTNVAVDRYLKSNNRLLILGFNSTLTEPVDALGRNGQIKELEFKLHPDIKEPLKKLCDDPKTTIVVLSGCDRTVLDDNFGEYNMWLAAENGMFLRLTKGKWMTTMPENLHMDWVDSVKHVFEYFTERTPRSHFEVRETSLVWNYKYADIEFGRLQARDMLQHLWTGPISNASVDVIQGGRSVEVRAVGVTKGAAIDRILGEIVHYKGMKSPIDYVLCIGHFIAKDEDVYTFFEPELPSESPPASRAMVANLVRTSVPKTSASKSGSKAARLRKQRSLSALEKKAANDGSGTAPEPILQDKTSLYEGSSVLDLKGDNYFSCAVGRKRSNARYLLGSSDDVVTLLEELAQCSS
ncbi:hypothetical protein CMV_030504 [Castanea mollissima]|uniref:Uncharacterized protein n=1 Tax=Castanea mollissima TaxID=60419 RepID=A0A8J4VCA5_9ROSI|nr:hypothetical protein CMV_030504 [Castanea mollissima]